MFIFFSIKKQSLKSLRGFILPFTLLISTLILLIITTGSSIISKQLFFSKLYKQSQTAYYAADDAVACAIAIDDTYLGADGYGIFPGGIAGDPNIYMSDILDYVNTQRLILGKSIISLTDIKCAQVAIFDTTTGANKPAFSISSTDYQYNGGSGLETGKSSSFFMHIPVDDIDSYRCARVTVNKTPSFRQVIAQGYSSCSLGSAVVERAVVNQSITDGGALSPTAQALVGYIEDLQYTSGSGNGALRLSTGPSFYDGGTAYYQVNPYFSHVAALQVLLSNDPRSLTIAQNWIQWFFDHMDSSDHTVYDHWYNSVGGQERLCDGSNICDIEDATDSNLALFFIVLDRYIAQGGDPAVITSNAVKLGQMKDKLLSLMQVDDLTWAKSVWQFKYLMDNVEVYAGLTGLSYVYTNVLSDSTTGASLLAQAGDTKNAVESEFYDSISKTYRIHKDTIGSLQSANMTTWYPDSVAQTWPALFYSIYSPPSYGSNPRLAWGTFNTAWSNWDTHLYDPSLFPWISVGVSGYSSGYSIKSTSFSNDLKARYPDIETEMPPLQLNELGWWLGLELLTQ